LDLGQIHAIDSLFQMKDGTAWVRVQHQEGFHMLMPWPWFDVPQRQTADSVVAFGHWSTLGWLERSDVWALDSGCVWGGCLSALVLDPLHQQHSLIQVRCEQAQTPG